MFSANQNIALREHKRRVVSFVESTIPEDALDLGTMVMAMEVSCKAPGCVPLETVVTIVFPRGQTKELIPGLPESGSGGNYKTKILMPLSEVTKDDVLDALPPEFEGGRRTMESLCLRARDVMLGQIGQIMGEEDPDGRKLMAEYLMSCLKDYVDRDCVTPEVGEAFPPLQEKCELPSVHVPTAGNFVVRRKTDNNDKKVAIAGQATATATADTKDNETPNTSHSSHNPHRTEKPNSNNAANDTNGIATAAGRRDDNAMDWRRRNKIDAEINAFKASVSSQSIIKKLSEREHAAGVRRPGCPCCDPDNPSNVVDNMMML